MTVRALKRLPAVVSCCGGGAGTRRAERGGLEIGGLYLPAAVHMCVFVFRLWVLLEGTRCEEQCNSEARNSATVNSCRTSMCVLVLYVCI